MLLLTHFLLIQWRSPWQWMLPMVLFVAISLLFAVSGAQLLPLVPLTLALFSSTQSLFSPFMQHDYIALLHVRHIPLQAVALVQLCLGWLLHALPLLVVIAVWQQDFPVTMMIASIGLQSLVVMIAALLADNRLAGVAPIILLPLSVPILIFASYADGTQWLLAICGVYLAACPWVAGALLREHLRHQ